MARGVASKEKKYSFRQVIICKECGTVSERPGPCVKCEKTIFEIVLAVQETK